MTTLFFSCASNEIGDSKDVNPESVFFDYRIFGDGDSGNITVKLQYRFAGPNGTTLVLKDPAKVELDGENIQVDSSKMNGAYYEITKAVNAFNGRHSILFTGTDKKQYKEDFNFFPISLRAAVPDTIKRSDLVFELDGLEIEDYVRIIATDTSFRSEGINRVDTVRNGRIMIRKEQLKSLVNGPVHLELYKELDRPVKNGTKEGGRISFNYGLKRDFILKD